VLYLGWKAPNLCGDSGIGRADTRGSRELVAGVGEKIGGRVHAQDVQRRNGRTSGRREEKDHRNFTSKKGEREAVNVGKVASTANWMHLLLLAWRVREEGGFRFEL